MTTKDHPGSPEITLHSSFREGGSDLHEILNCAVSFLRGDCGELDDEDSVMEFLSKGIKNEIRYGVYETETGGRVHVIGDDKNLAIVPDIIFAQGVHGAPPCEDSNCECRKL